MSGLLTPDARLRVFSDTGVVLNGAKLYTYVAGSLTTQLATYSDSALSVPNANPVVASAGGLFGPIYLTPGSAYQFLLKDSSGVTVPGWPQDNVSVPAAISGLTVAQGGTGAVTLAAHGVLIGEGTSAVAVTGAGTAGQVLTSNGAAADPTFQAGSVVTLLKANNGSDTSAGATTVDSIAITGLTANDRLKVFYSLTGTVANTAQVVLYSVTDAATVVALSPSPLAFGDATAAAGEVQIGQRQGSANQVVSVNQGMLGTPARNDFILFTAPATAWTGSWTLGLRHGGVTATGTLKWSWAVFKFAGQ